MNKLLVICFTAGLLALAACGGSENKNAEAARDSAAAAASAANADSMLKMSGDTTTKISADTTKK